MGAKKLTSVAKKKRKSPKKMLGTCFVLMPFREPFDTYYLSIIKPAVHAARLTAVRGDSLFRPSPIMADIWQMTQDAKVLVAELTEKNANVFYELGLAHAIGKPVVLIADNLTDIPFDLQSLRVIIYDKNEPAWGTELKTNITDSLGETLEDTASAVPSMFRKVVKSQAPTETKTEMRLDELERRMSALAGRSSSFPRPIRMPSDLHSKLKRARSRDEAMEITYNAVRSGMSPKLIFQVLRSTVSANEARTIFRELRLPRSD
jgi:hypothetical protein